MSFEFAWAQIEDGRVRVKTQFKEQMMTIQEFRDFVAQKNISLQQLIITKDGQEDILKEHEHMFYNFIDSYKNGFSIANERVELNPIQENVVPLSEFPRKYKVTGVYEVIGSQTGHQMDLTIVLECENFPEKMLAKTRWMTQLYYSGCFATEEDLETFRSL